MLEKLDQSRDVAIERLLEAELDGVGRHGPPSVVVRHPVERVGKRPPGIGSGNDEAFPAFGDQLSRAIAGGGDDRQAAGEGLEDDERTRVVVGRQGEEIARMETRADVRLEPEQVDDFAQAQVTDHRPERSGLPAAAGEQVNRSSGRVASATLLHRQEQRLQALEPVVVADEQGDQVVRLQAKFAPEIATSRRGVVQGKSTGVDGVGNDVDSLARDVVMLRQVVLDHCRDRDDLGPSVRVVLLTLDRPVDPRLGVRLLADDVSLSPPAGGKASGVGFEAGLVDSTLRDDDVVVPGIDEADRAIVSSVQPA